MPADCFSAVPRLQAFFQTLLNHPILILLPACSLAALAYWAFRSRQPLAVSIVPLEQAAPWLLGVYLGFAAAYLFYPNYLDHVEPAIAVIAQQVLRGQQIYLAPDSAQRISLLYGPSLFITNAVSMAAVPNPVLGSKLSGFFLAAGAFGLCAFAFTRLFGRTRALLLLGLLALGALWFQDFTYASRADALVFCCASAALAAVTLRGRWRRIATLGLALGIALNTKLHTGLYFLPFLVLLWQRHGWLEMALAGILAAAAAAAPFVLWPRIFALTGYLQLLRVAASAPLVGEAFAINVQYALLLLLPWAMALFVTRRRVDSPWSMAAGLAAMLVVCVIGSTVGAGPYHLFPFAPFAACLFGQALPSKAAPIPLTPILGILGAGWLAVAVTLSAANNCAVAHTVFGSYANARRNVSDLLAIEQRYSGRTIQMGYGNNNYYERTWLRPWLTQHFEPLVDAVALSDMRAAGQTIPPATFAALTTQQSDLWLIPRGSYPFSLPNWSDPGQLVFEADWRAAFVANYSKADSTDFYDIWQARRLTAP